MFFYKLFYEKVICKIDAEEAHNKGMRSISIFGKTPFASIAYKTIFNRGGEAIKGIFGRPIPGRVGLAAGQDKNAEAILGLDALGFAFVEVGTVTPLPQNGNDKPRLWRLNNKRAFRNSPCAYAD